MEGLTDVYMRAVLTAISPYDWCVSEFLRVTDHLYAPAVFLRHCPELADGGKTPAGTPVHLQLLGSDPAAMADNAARAAALGAPAIDINFGCPAKTVNRSGGGASLLADAEQLYRIVSAVRQAVPRQTPVSAKMRLGLEDKAALLDNAAAIHQGGADWLTIHARTKAQGYRPPVDWGAIASVRERYPQWRLIANGDIDSVAAAQACMAVTGCRDLMIGRAAVREPDLVARIKQPGRPRMTWMAVAQAQLALLTRMAGTEKGIAGRYKQWLAMTTTAYPEAAALFQQIKRSDDVAFIRAHAEHLMSPADQVP